MASWQRHHHPNKHHFCPANRPKTKLSQQFAKSFALRDCDHLVFTFTSMDSELKRWEARQQLILDVLESHVGPQREPAPDKPTRFGTICLNALGNSASNKSTQLRVALKQATRFFCTLVFKHMVAHTSIVSSITISPVGLSALHCSLQTRHFKSRFTKSAYFVSLAAAHAKYFSQ